ncbi:hypothetical protein KFL_014150010, partial [Klebsormidium nitens]
MVAVGFEGGRAPLRLVQRRKEVRTGGDGYRTRTSAPTRSGGQLGVPLTGLNAEAWLGPQLRVFVTSEGADDSPAVCVLAGMSAFCSRCSERERCPHVKRVLTATGGGDGVQSGPAHKATKRGATNSDKRAERSALRASGQWKLWVCNDPMCRRPDLKVACVHGGTLEEWECLPAAALDMGHSHKKIDTVMSRGGQQVTSLCERWGDEGIRKRDGAKYFCAPRPEDAIFNFSGTTLISHGLLLRNHFAAALGASHSLNFDANNMATRSLEGPSASRLDDRVFDAAMQAFNDLAARPRIQHVCKRPDCAYLYTSEVRAAEAEAERAGCPLQPERTEGPPLNLSTYAFSRDKVITFDGTFSPNSRAMRDSNEASLYSICEPDPGAPRVAGGFTPLGVGGMRPSDVPLEGIDCPSKFRNGLSELRPAVRAAAFRWCNFWKGQGQGANSPLSAEEFVAMRQGLPANVRALIDLATESGSCADPTTCAVCKAVPRRPWMDGVLKGGPVAPTGWCPTHFQPYAALVHALLIPRYSWVFGHIVTLKLLRHLLLEGPVDERGLAYLTNDGPMLAAILRLHPTVGVQTGPRQYAFPAALRPLVRDIYATNLLCFEPSANRPSASSGRSPLAALLDATEHLWFLERERLRACMGAVSIYAFHPLLYGRPQFTDWEDASGRGKKGSEERLAQHCGAPNPRSSKSRAGMFIACCQDRAPLGYHWLKGGESVSDLGTVLITRFPFKTLRGLTVVEDAACNAQEWLINR